MYKWKDALLGVLILAAGGCAAAQYAEQIHTLQAVNESQQDIRRYVELKEKLFNLLLEDVKNERLKLGITKKHVINTYGRPVLVREISGGVDREEELLYRHPTRYFSSDKIYLYFDSSGRLMRWEHKAFQRR